MAVKFDKEGYTISIQTNSNPVEDWMNTYDDLLSLLASVDQNMASPNKYYHAIVLMHVVCQPAPLVHYLMLILNLIIMAIYYFVKSYTANAFSSHVPLYCNVKEVMIEKGGCDGPL